MTCSLGLETGGTGQVMYDTNIYTNERDMALARACCHPLLVLKHCSPW
jgi:hypothetical protein